MATVSAPLGVEASRLRRILGLALPLVGGMVSQNVLNLVDTAMVGTLGDAALAAVGTGSFANFFASAFVTGLSTGVQAMAARRQGEGRTEITAEALDGGLVLAVLIAVPLSATLFLLAPRLFPLLNDDPQVVGQAVPYLRARLVAMAALGANFAFRGYWNGTNRAGLYFRTILAMHSVNIFLNWVLIFGHLGAPALGTQGAGVASAAAVYFGTLYYLYLGTRHARANGFLRCWPSRDRLWALLKLSLPSSLQQTFFAGGFTVLFWIIGRISTQATAAASVLVNLMLVAILPGLALGLAAGSLAGQALGRRDPQDAKRWGWDVVKVAVLVMFALGLPMLLLPDLLLRPFIHSPETLALARVPLMLVGVGIAADGVGLVLLNALMGVGATRLAAVVSVSLQWLLFLPAAYLFGPALGFGLVGVWGAQVAYRALQAAIFAFLWQRGQWAKIRL
ncbi:MAG: MATE family efflux transporter [Deltaproteobacteria bacterium]|nr:MAG: MATE family efflux transporter [Deltaproteobacteria bacterium]